MSQVQCPRCGNSVESLQQVDPQTLAKHNGEGSQTPVPEKVCSSCLSQISVGASRGSVLLAREKAKEQKKLMLWKSRVNMIKKARQEFQDKAFSDAAVAYEKYIRVLEVVFDTEPGGLSPEHFKDSARTQELTVVASVYWDLLRIYDTSGKYGERQSLAAKKLSQFLRFTPIYPDILRKAETFARSAKNPSVIKGFLKQASEEKGRCFIASSVFESPWADEVFFLQNWRDQHLNSSLTGKIFVKFYYFFAPTLSFWLDQLPILKAPVRYLLRCLIALLVISEANTESMRRQ